jgi:hypothetical protein
MAVDEAIALGDVAGLPIGVDNSVSKLSCQGRARQLALFRYQICSNPWAQEHGRSSRENQL